MGHPLVDEFCRAHELRPEFFRRCQRVFRDEVQPQLDERERLIEENHSLLEQLNALKKKTAKRPEEAGVPA